MSKKYKDWQLKYIELSSDISQNYTDLQLAKLIGISRQSISEFKRHNPEIHEIIFNNIKKQTNKLGNEAMKSLYHMLKKNPKALQIALEIASIYVPKSEIMNKYDTMEKKDLIKDIKHSFNRILKSNDIKLDKD